jgi:hypothetical protein
MTLSGSSGNFTIRTAGAGAIDSQVPYSEVFRIENNGDVGIGTSNPNYKLHVIGNIWSFEMHSLKVSTDVVESKMHHGVRSLSGHIYCIPNYTVRAYTNTGSYGQYTNLQGAYIYWFDALLAMKSALEIPWGSYIMVSGGIHSLDPIAYIEFSSSNRIELWGKDSDGSNTRIILQPWGEKLHYSNYLGVISF